MFTLRAALVLGALALPSFAQLQLYTSNSTFPNASLSSSCQAALIASIDCDPSVQLLSSVNSAASSYLSSICTSTCSSALASFRSSIVSACTSNDYLTIGGTQYPPTFPVDYVTHYFNAACLTSDSSYCIDNTGAYYNTSLANANVASYADLPDSMVCDPCFLSWGQLVLQSPYVFSNQLAANWSSITSRCSTSDYGYTAPTTTISAPSPYTTNTVNGTKLDTSSCVYGSYVVQNGDTCTSIQNAQSVPATQVIALNGLDQGCTLLSQEVGSSICLPAKCQLYTVQTNDTCATIALNYGLTSTQLISLNFQIDAACVTLPSLVGTDICVSLSDYTPTVPSSYPATTPTAPAPTPTGIPVAPSTVPSQCGEWHVVVGGDTCNQLSINYQLSLADLYQLNPMLNSNCTNLYLNYSYCVEPFNVTLGGTATVGPASWPTPVNITYIPPSFAPGTISNCSSWFMENDGQTCEDIISLNNITMAQLQGWNPSLSPDCDAALVTDLLYCVWSDVAVSGTGTSGGSGSPGATPSPLASGVVTGCTGFFLETNLLCYEIVAQYDITLDQFYAWNGGSGVCSVLQSGEYYCINGPATATTSAPTTTTSAPSGPATPSPLASGVVAGCTEFFQETDLYCYQIVANYDITLDQFYAWNGGSNVCNVLQSGEYYCVNGPAVAATTTSAAPSGVQTPSPLASGVVAGCTAFFQETDLYCYQIVDNYDITLDQFEAWNGGSNVCNVLQSGEYYCVAGPATS